MRCVAWRQLLVVEEHYARLMHHTQYPTAHTTNMQEDDTQTPLHAAARQDAAMVHTLLAAGCNPNAMDKLGLTPLHDAACEGRADATKLLLEAGAIPVVGDRHGKTPLHYAAESGYIEVIDVLVEATARVSSASSSSVLSAGGAAGGAAVASSVATTAGVAGAGSGARGAAATTGGVASSAAPLTAGPTAATAAAAAPTASSSTGGALDGARRALTAAVARRAEGRHPRQPPLAAGPLVASVAMSLTMTMTWTRMTRMTAAGWRTTAAVGAGQRAALQPAPCRCQTTTLTCAHGVATTASC